MEKTPKPNTSLQRQFLPGQRQLRVAFAEREKVPSLTDFPGKIPANQGDQPKRLQCNSWDKFSWNTKRKLLDLCVGFLFKSVS